MNQGNRKLIGAALLPASVVGWVVLFTAIYLVLPEGLPWWVLILYFAIAGMGWFLPAAVIIRWMVRP
jgi:RsiW-degrading membrane proteinase PrsW (M82 family)